MGIPITKATKTSIPLDSMHAHKGHCRKCNQRMVKMFRNESTGKLMPHRCVCLNCGQWYHMRIADLTAWEASQWDEKRLENEA